MMPKANTPTISALTDSQVGENTNISFDDPREEGNVSKLLIPESILERIMQTWPLHKLESVTDDEIREATSIVAVVLSNEALIPIIPPEQGDKSTPLCIVVEKPDAVDEVREHVAKVLC